MDPRQTLPPRTNQPRRNYLTKKSPQLTKTPFNWTLGKIEIFNGSK